MVRGMNTTTTAEKSTELSPDKIELVNALRAAMGLITAGTDPRFSHEDFNRTARDILIRSAAILRKTLPKAGTADRSAYEAEYV